MFSARKRSFTWHVLIFLCHQQLLLQSSSLHFLLWFIQRTAVVVLWKVAEIWAPLMDHMKAYFSNFGINLFSCGCFLCRETWDLTIKLELMCVSYYPEGEKNQRTLYVKYSKGWKIAPPNEACRAGPSCVLYELGTLWEKIPCKTLPGYFIFLLNHTLLLILLTTLWELMMLQPSIWEKFFKELFLTGGGFKPSGKATVLGILFFL